MRVSTASLEIRKSLGRALSFYEWHSDPVFEKLEGGLVHHSFSVNDGNREYILQRVNPLFSLSIHENIDRITRHLIDKKVVTFHIVRTRADQLFVDLGKDGVWRLLTRLGGETHPINGKVEQVRSAGGLVARFHNALLDFDGELHHLGFVFHDTDAYMSMLESALRRYHSHRLFPDVADLAVEIFKYWDNRLSKDHKIPSRVIHGDLKWSNILFNKDDTGLCAHGLIDLDTVSRLPLYIDLGDAWRSWCNSSGEDSETAEFDLNLFRASVEGYFDEVLIEIQDEERNSLIGAIEMLSLELATRFTCDSLEERYFRWSADVCDSAGEHNLIRARGQLSLLRQCIDTRSERARILGMA